MKFASTAWSSGAKKKQIYIALNKPVGIICTTETHIEDNIIELVGHFRSGSFPWAGWTRIRKD